MSKVVDELFDLSGKVAVITGGSRGLGREMALAFADRGADIVISSRKQDACAATAAEVAERSGREAFALSADVGDWGACDALIDAVYERVGRVDVLINNAGMSPLYPSLEEVGESAFDKVIAVNLKGPFRLTAALGPRMAADGGGSILNISSIASVRPAPEFLPYAAAKAGLNALTEGFAKAFGPSVRVNGIIAGPFLTDISRSWDLDVVAAHARATMALGRVGRPEEIIGAALYFASSASSYSTGAMLRLDGGTP
ncbi:MAG: SDR family NAD(P)-dependent oxidoreductase [Solirubrobacterales bacterium]